MKYPLSCIWKVRINVLGMVLQRKQIIRIINPDKLTVWWFRIYQLYNGLKNICMPCPILSILIFFLKLRICDKTFCHDSGQQQPSVSCQPSDHKGKYVILYKAMYLQAAMFDRLHVLYAVFTYFIFYTSITGIQVYHKFKVRERQISRG